MKVWELERCISHAARVGAINLDEIDSPATAQFAAKWSSHYRAVVEGLDEDVVWEAIQKAKARGKRTFRSGCGLWLTDKEFAN